MGCSRALSQALMMQSTALHPESIVGVIYAWGTDSDGQLGIYNGRDSPKILIFPRMLTYLKDVVITEVAAGALHCLAISIDGLCYAWGKNKGFQLGLCPRHARACGPACTPKSREQHQKGSLRIPALDPADRGGQSTDHGPRRGGLLGH